MSDFCACDWDGDEPAMYAQSQPTARKRHICFECNGHIRPGERYWRVAMLYDGEGFQTYRTCSPCYDGPHEFVRRNCGCWLHGGLFEHLSEVFREHEFVHPGVKFRVGRWLIEARRRGVNARQVAHA